ncbi:MAG TPA: ABC transporter permease [Acidimicrobiales bacterium]|nr:ABC transporter permease [Acidimicrobiales bacterium]
MDPDEILAPHISPWKGFVTANILWILLIEAGLILAFTAIEPHFLKPFNIRSIFADQSYLMVLAVGQTFVVVTGGIDLSIGAVLIFSGVVAGRVMLALHGQPTEFGAGDASWAVIAVGITAGLGAGLSWGVLNGLLTTKLKMPPFIVTLGTLGMATGGSYLLTGGTDLRGIPTKFTELIGFGSLFGQVPYQVVIAALVSVILGLTLVYTRFGRYSYAIGSNREATRRFGINVDRHLIKVYALMGLLAGIAGTMSLAHYTTTTIAGHNTDNLGAIAAAVIGGASLFGGRGSVAGSVIGVLIPATLASGFVIIGVNPYWQYVAVGMVLIIAVYLDQVRRRTRERT